jgi:glycosyltransferase involved in cell wall biosynthesis
MKRMVGDLVERSRYDVVITEFARMAQHIYRNPYLPAVRRVVSCHRSLTMLHQNELKYLGWGPVSLFQRMRLKGMEAFEFSLYRNADHVMVLTPQERFWMLSRLPRVHISVVPSGVDTHYYTHDPKRKKENAIVFTGNYRDSANEDAVRWFLKKVWPQLSARNPDLLFYIVGPSPSRAMQALAARCDGVRIVGRVDDLRTYLYRAKVLVCPVRVGAGIRTKVLEAMASGVPVVSTVLGVEGIPAQVGDNCFLADQADIMCEYTHMLLHDHEMALGIADRARAMIEERFTWDASLARLELTLERFVTGSS